MRFAPMRSVMLQGLVILLHYAPASTYRMGNYDAAAIENRTRTRWLAQCVTPPGKAKGATSYMRAACCDAWYSKVALHFEGLREQFRLSRTFYWGRRVAPFANTTKQAYDLHEPTWQCESNERVPKAPGDGPKQMCGVGALVRSPRCLIYSFGSNGHVSFERALKARQPSCEIVTFDPLLELLPNNAEKVAAVRQAEREGVLRFVPMGLVGIDPTTNRPQELKYKGVHVPAKTFPELMAGAWP